MTTTLVYTTQPVPLHHVKPGACIEYDSVVYKVFRFLRVIQPGGWVAVAVARDPGGGWDGESVALYFADRAAIVLLVCGKEMPGGGR